MTRVRRKKKKVFRFLVLFIILIGIVGSYLFCKDYTSDRSKLERIGYSEEEILLIVNNKVNLDYALRHDYDEVLISFISDDNYDSKNLEKYFSYKDSNVTAPINDIIYLVNNNIDNSYSKTLMSLLGYEYFVEDYLDRYLSYEEKNPSKSIKDIVTNINSNLDHPFYTDIKSTDVSKGKLMLVNKYNQLSKEYKGNLVSMDSKYTKVSAELESETYNAFKKLSDDARNSGLYIVNVSAYRSYDTQNYLYNGYKSTNGLVWADSYSARAGHSEHQTGLALDVGSNSTTSLGSFENTPEFTWMKANAHKYGFILRYQKNKEYITGYNYEPWHYRYVGVEAATYIYEKNITFEEYYAVFVK